MSVPALMSAPIASKIWSISSEPKRSVPLNSMCSSRWEMPASPSSSAAEPVAIQKPSATERTPGTRSVTTRTPLSSVVMLWSGLNCAPFDPSITPVAWASGAALASTARSAITPAAAVA